MKNEEQHCKDDLVRTIGAAKHIGIIMCTLSQNGVLCRASAKRNGFLKKEAANKQ